LFGAEGLLPSWSKFPLIVLITSIVWIVVTFMTQPEESDVLEKFYKKTQPGGPGWDKIVNEANTNGNNIVDTKEGWSVPSGILAMLVGCVLIYSVMFTTGNFIYGNYTNAFVLLGVSVISGLILIKLWKKIKANIL
jgi:protein-S-isoprenylcysteine O-methyltransferase Ste14